MFEVGQVYMVDGRHTSTVIKVDEKHVVFDKYLFLNTYCRNCNGVNYDLDMVNRWILRGRVALVETATDINQQCAHANRMEYAGITNKYFYCADCGSKL